ncbi:MAG: ribbon-helix-helix protein, CopG family [Cypionkella sp.]
MPRKTPLSVYLDPSLLRDLDAFAAERRKPRSLVIEAAIRSFLTPDDAERREAAIAKRLDRVVRVLERLERNDGVTLEALAMFIRFWLTATPSLPEQTTAAARQKGSERYDRFIDALGRRLANGPSVLKEVASEVEASND